jgi:hypothetical protein
MLLLLLISDLLLRLYRLEGCCLVFDSFDLLFKAFALSKYAWVLLWHFSLRFHNVIKSRLKALVLLLPLLLCLFNVPGVLFNLVDFGFDAACILLDSHGVLLNVDEHLLPLLIILNFVDAFDPLHLNVKLDARDLLQVDHLI